MPASRKRPSGKNCSRNKLRHRRRTSTAAAASRARQDVPTADPNRSTEQMTVSVPADELQDFLDSHLTGRDRELALQSLRAAANGDAARALDLRRQGLHVKGAAAEHELLDVLLLGDEAPDWVLCRWIARQAYPWLLLTEDPRTDAAGAPDPRGDVRAAGLADPRTAASLGHSGRGSRLDLSRAGDVRLRVRELVTLGVDPEIAEAVCTVERLW
jgi:hypothetical protein